MKKYIIVIIMYLSRINNEYKDLKTNPIKNCTAEPIDDDITHWKATIKGPDDTPYQNGEFNIDIKFTDEYPCKPPIIKFLTPIYHCNINSSGGICLDILKDKWSPILTIQKVLLSILSLLADPNPDDALVPEIGILFKKNKKLHDKNAKHFTLKHSKN